MLPLPSLSCHQLMADQVYHLHFPPLTEAISRPPNVSSSALQGACLRDKGFMRTWPQHQVTAEQDNGPFLIAANSQASFSDCCVTLLLQSACLNHDL